MKKESVSMTQIKWREIHDRLEKTKAALNLGAEASPEENKKVLRARAKLLARETDAGKPRQEQIEVVGFVLAYENFAVESSFVREVYPLKYLARLPGTPTFVAGIVNVRGEIVSVINLKKFFGLPDKGLTDLNKIIILRDGKIEFGILADAMLGVMSMAMEELESPLPALTGARGQYFKGVAAGRMAVLDAARLMSDPAINMGKTIET